MSTSFASIKRRLRVLRNVESANVVFLPAAFVVLWSGADQPVNWSLRLLALAVVVYILIQGSFYWHLKLRAVTNRNGLPVYFASLFRFFKRSNVAAAAGMSLFIVLAALTGRATPVDVVWSAGLTLFAVLEHVNYYAYQLTHDSINDLAYLWRHRRLRRSALAKDLEGEAANLSAH